MRRTILALILFAWPAALVHAGEFAQTIRQVELKSEPFADATTVATVPEQTKVEILKRQGAWIQVKAAQTGWLRMLSVRSAGGEKKEGDTGISSLLNVARSGTSGTTVATGVRGLSEEDLKNAKPDPKELEKMLEHSVASEEARKFAGTVKLSSQSIEYLSATGGTNKPEDGKPAKEGGKR